MKKITGLILILSVLLTATACNADTDSTNESTSSTESQTTSAILTEDTSKTETTSQTEQTTESTTVESTTEQGVTDIEPTEKEIHILELNRRTFYDYKWSEEYAIPMVECEYSGILLSGEDADKYSELAVVLIDAVAAGESSMKDESAMLSEAVDEMSAMGMECQEALSSKLHAQVRRADENVLSVLTDCSYNNGMNGGHRSFWGNNYDTQTGKEIYLPDVVTDMDKFVKAVEDKLFSTFGADIFYRDDIIKEYFEMYGADGTHWSLDYNGVTVYFDGGEIAGDGIGLINVTITFAEHPELFNEKYTEVPEAYIVSLPMKSTFYTDLDGDGECEELAIYDRYDEENNYYTTLDIYTDDDTYSESFWAYSCEPYYVKNNDGKHYLYLFTELETQMYLYVYDITNGTIGKAGEANVSPYYNDGISAVLTDTCSMHFDIFSEEAGGGVPEGNDIFAVGVDGMPAQG